MVPIIVPFVPFSNTTIVNKTIVYSDTVLNIKELGQNLRVTTISDVGEYSFERCLKIIFESNPNVIFNTIQYSRSENKVYFYTNSEISTKAWNDTKITKTEYSALNTEVLEDLKQLFLSTPKIGEDYISIYSLGVFLKDKYSEIQGEIDEFKSILDDKAKEFIGKDYTFLISFDWSTHELCITFVDHYSYKDKSLDRDHKYRFSKKDGDLYITQSENGWLYKDKIIPYFGKELSDLYDLFIKNKYFYTVDKSRIKLINSGFALIINDSFVSIYISKSGYFYNVEFSLSKHYCFDEERYNCECNSYNISSLLAGKEKELLRRIYVKIDDCPEWMKQSLHERNQKYLEQERILAEKQAKKERVKVRVRKFFHL